MTVLHNLEQIKQNIAEACKRAGRNPNEVNIIAVTKYVSVERAKEAIEAGVQHLGENRDQGLHAKQEVITDPVNWHFIGSLQTRKVKSVIHDIDYLHSLDRLSLAEEVQKRASDTVKCFIQVNVAEEQSKHGLSVDEVIPFIESLHDFSHIQIVGLMTMAPHTDDQALLRHCFHTLKQLQKDVQALQLAYAPCTELSMGMSNDYEIAVEEGATYIRLGTTLVGNEI
ncbi:YggS family pyridoxal phosphate-dependent enzyme [Priestia koreensis]|uniref:YggS family pyridoxal phosphate-dependent enzyme n=1 Tax=Priestia koreensis TaxID=284581 RepID=UPI001F57BBE4|nr:YggS family pyridoxal phosphate-dependent enzyme [Priestia koreensis]MCM3003853.1 YggS family pyridoxal phosphate-dependent enzyme [Priestia koreensis]UNL83953.1 YggS family pyridoxal phosphate-dependent enzyme [Priestia koreensis]